MASKRHIATRKQAWTERRVRVGKLETAQQVARFQARVIKAVVRKGGEGTAEYRLCTMASMLARTLEASDIERRIEALEALLEQRGKL